MGNPALKMATWEDLLAYPEGTHAEAIRGVIHVEPNPLPRHADFVGRLRTRVGSVLDPDDDDPAGWWILAEVDVRLGPHDIVEPDIAGWRRARLPDPFDTRPIDVVPDWVCEVLSPSTAARDRGQKMALYARVGVPHAWLVAPVDRTIEVYANEGGRFVLLGAWGEGDTAALPPFETLVLDIARLFPPVGRRRE